MKPILVLYATREGQTQRIAEHILALARSNGFEVAIVDVAHVPENFSLDLYSAAIVSASVHGGKHEREMRQFVKFHRAALEAMPAAFLSVSLSEASAEDMSMPPDRRSQAAEDAGRMIDRFLQETGWVPHRIKAVAGALVFTKYNFLMRLVMKSIARKAGETDLTHDHEYTDWVDLDRFVSEFLIGLPRPAAQPAA